MSDSKIPPEKTTSPTGHEELEAHRAAKLKGDCEAPEPPEEPASAPPVAPTPTPAKTPDSR